MTGDRADPAASVAVTATKRVTPEPQSAPAVEKDQLQKAIKNLLARADQTVDDKLVASRIYGRDTGMMPFKMKAAGSNAALKLMEWGARSTSARIQRVRISCHSFGISKRGWRSVVT